MIQKCFNTYCYLPHEVVCCDPWLITIWLKSDNHQTFTLKRFLTDFLIDDINGIIKNYHYHLEYDILFHKL